jgi:uncharacterized membrane protein
VGALSRLIAHHASGAGLVIEGFVLVALVIFFGWIWLRERRRRLDGSRGVTDMRD